MALQSFGSIPRIDLAEIEFAMKDGTRTVMFKLPTAVVDDLVRGNLSKYEHRKWFNRNRALVDATAARIYPRDTFTLSDFAGMSLD